MSAQFLLDTLPYLIGGGLLLGAAGILGWIHVTRLRIHNGYPLSGMWGQSEYPQVSNEAQERIKLLSQENAQLRAEIGSIKDRLANVERIVTDESHQLSNEIESLRLGASRN